MKKLIVSVALLILSVNENDDGWVVKLLDKLSGIEHHRKSLAAPLRVPDYAAALVAIRICCGECAFDCLVHRVELVVGRNLFLGYYLR